MDVLDGLGHCLMDLSENLLYFRGRASHAGFTETLKFLTDCGYKIIPGSQSNCFMIDTGRNGRQVMAAMAQKKVIIGRTWPIWPNVVRVSVGTKEDMAKFRTAFKEVMDTPVKAELEQMQRIAVPVHFS